MDTKFTCIRHDPYKTPAYNPCASKKGKQRKNSSIALARDDEKTRGLCNKCINLDLYDEKKEQNFFKRKKNRNMGF